MLVFEVFRADKAQRFVRTVRDQGLRVALFDTVRYLRARLWGHGLTGLFRTQKKQDKQASYLAAIWTDLARKNAFHVTAAPALLSRRRKVVMVGDLNLPQCRKYRVEQLDELWRQQGVDYDFAHYEDLPRCANLMQDSTHLMLYRLASGPPVSTLLYEARRLRLPILYDIDDPLFSVSAYATYGNMTEIAPQDHLGFLNAAPRYLDVMAASDLVSVATPGLVSHAARYCSRPVYLRRNFADSLSLRQGVRASQLAQSTKSKDVFRVGFASGSRGHEADFAIIAQEIYRFVRGAANRRLVLLGYFDRTRLPPDIAKQTDYYPFLAYADYLTHLAQLDCVVMPLANDAFNTCKSGVRALDAASVAVPALVSPVGDQASIVANGETGFVISVAADWGERLSTLARTSGLARKMGAAAQANLAQNWGARCELPIIDPEILKWVVA